jgi:hypothetical protein
MKFTSAIIQNIKVYLGYFLEHRVADAIKTNENAKRPSVPK